MERWFLPDDEDGIHELVSSKSNEAQHTDTEVTLDPGKHTD